MLTHIHLSSPWFTARLDIASCFSNIPGSVSCIGASLCPPCTESPFAPSRCYLFGSNTSCYLSRRYSAIFAHTGSCARPCFSPALCQWLAVESLCRLLQVPAGTWPFPINSRGLGRTLSVASPSFIKGSEDNLGCLGTYHRWVLTVHLPISSHKNIGLPLP